MKVRNAYKDFDGNYIDGCDMIFEEESDDTFSNDWGMNDTKYYEEILKENQYIASLEFKKYL